MRGFFRKLGAGLIYACCMAYLLPAHALLLVGPTNNLSGTGQILFFGDTETWLFEANPAGGDVTIVGTPDPSLQLTETVTAPNGAIVGTATGASPGSVVNLNNVPLFMAGIWSITVSGNAGTTGNYILQAFGVQDPFNGSQASIHSLATAPEPATLALIGLGLAGLAAMRRRKPNA